MKTLHHSTQPVPPHPPFPPLPLPLLLIQNRQVNNLDTMLPRQRLAPPKPLMIIRLLRPKHFPTLFHLQQNAPHLAQALSAPVAREETCVAVVEGVSDAFYHARLGIVAYDDDVGEDVAGTERGDVVVWKRG
jgi:hypothetical protein